MVLFFWARFGGPFFIGVVMADKIGGKTVLLFEADASQLQQTKEQVKQGLQEVGQAGQDAGKAASAGLKQVDVAADSAAQAVKATGTAARDTAKDVQQVGTSAAAAGKGLRETAGAADGLTAAQRRLVQAAERSAIQAEEGAAGWLRYRAAQQGVSDVIAPYVTRMEAARAGTAGLGVSAGQTAAAMRQLPAQFSDIVVSLQGGQAPLSVFLQQGSQIKDSFGGAGAAVRALGGYVAALITPVTVGAAAFVALAAGAAAGYTQASELNRALIATGESTGKTRGELNQLAIDAGRLTGSYGNARAAVQALAESGRVSGDVLSAAVRGITAGVEVTGKSTKELTSIFEDIAKNPVKAVGELNERYHFLTQSVRDQIKALEDQGRTQEAANLAANTFADVMVGRSGEIQQSIGLIEKGWREVKAAISAAVDAVGSIGRKETIDDRIAMFESRSRENKAALPSAPVASRFFSRVTEKTEYLGAADFVELTNLREMRALEQARINRGRLEAERQARGEILDKYLSDTSRMSKAEQFTEAQKKAEKDFQASVAGLDQNTEKYKLAVQRRDTEIANARERLAAKPVRAPKISVDGNAGQLAGLDAEIAGYAKLLDSLRTTGDATVALNKHEAEAAKIGEQLTGTMNAKTRSFLEEKKAREEAAGVMLRQVDREKESIKLTSAFRQERDRYLGTLDGNVAKIHESAQAAEDEVATFGLSRQALADLTIARLEHRREMLAGFSGSEEEIDRINAEIAARRRLATALDEKDVLEANKKAGENLTREWDQVSDTVTQSLSDAIMSGGQSGTQLLKRLFANTVLQLVVQPLVKGGVNALSSALTGQESSNSSLAGTAKNISSLIPGGGIGNAISSGASSLANVTGLTSIGNFGGGLGSGISAFGNLTATMGNLEAGMIALKAGNIAGGLGSLVGTAAPYIGAAMAAYSLLSGSFKGETRSGGTFGWAGGQSQFLHGPSGGTAGQADAVNAAISATASGINDLLKGAGSALSVSSLIAGFEGSEKGRGGVMSGVTLSNGARLGEDGSGSNYKGTYYNRNLPTTLTTEAAAGLLVTDLKQLQIEVLQQADDIPAALRKLVEGVSAPALTDEAATALLATVTTQVSGVNTLRAALDALPFGAVVTSTYDAVAAFIEYSGGLDAATSNLQSYLQNYTSQEEQLAAQRKQITDALGAAGVALPNSKAAFRAIVESLDDTTESGARAKAAMLGVNQAFSDWITTSDEVAEAAREKSKKDADLALQPARDAIAALTTSFVDAAATAQTRVDTALQTVRDTYNTDKAALSNTISRLTSVIKSLDSTMSSLRVGDLSPDSLQQQYQTARGELDDLIAKALGGDEDAQGQVGSATEAFLRLSQQQFGATTAYAADFAKYSGDLARVRSSAAAQVDVAQQGLLRLDRMVEGIDLGNKLTVSLADAIKELSAATAANTAAKALVPPSAGGGGAAFTGDQKAIYEAYVKSGAGTPDAAGFQFWNDAVNNGASLSQIVAEIEAINAGKYGANSHASGLAFVPRDEYPMVAHIGEGVIDARTMQGLRKYGIPTNRGGDEVLAGEVRRLVQINERQAAMIAGLLAQTQRNGAQASADVEQQTRRLTSRSTAL